jgi:hypothetical protein
MKRSTTILLLIIAVLLISLSLIYPVRAEIGRSIHDGKWDIRYTNCQGRLVVYEDVRVTDVDENFITIVTERGKETRLPLRSVCSELIMDRKR